MGARKAVNLLQVRFPLLAPRGRFGVRLWMEPRQIVGYNLIRIRMGTKLHTRIIARRTFLVRSG